MNFSVSRTLALINGKQENRIDHNDRGLQYGDGVFRTLLLHGGQPLDLAMQLDKLRSDAQALNILPPDDADWMNDLDTLIKRGRDDCIIKLILTRGSSVSGYYSDPGSIATRITALYPKRERPASNWQSGVDLYLCDTRLGHNPILAGIKHLNRLEQVLARNEFDHHYQEGVMLDITNQLIGGTMSNIFLTKNGVLTTPLLSSCGIDGIMRKRILALAEQHAIKSKIQKLNVDDLLAADEVFLTNSVIGIWPVRRIHKQTWRPKSREMTSFFQSALKHPACIY